MYSPAWHRAGVGKVWLAKCASWAKSDPILVSISNVLSEHSCLRVVCCCFCAVTIVKRVAAEAVLLTNPKIFTIWPFTEKVSQTLVYKLLSMRQCCASGRICSPEKSGHRAILGEFTL